MTVLLWRNRDKLNSGKFLGSTTGETTTDPAVERALAEVLEQVAGRKRLSEQQQEQ